MQWTWSKAGGYWSMTAAAIEIIWTQNPTELTSSIETKSMLAVTRISEGHGARMAESLKFLVVMGLGIFILGGLGEMIMGYYLLTTMLLEIIGNQQAEELLEKMMNYCWWKKSCTSWYLCSVFVSIPSHSHLAASAPFADSPGAISGSSSPNVVVRCGCWFSDPEVVAIDGEYLYKPD